MKNRQLNLLFTILFTIGVGVFLCIRFYMVMVTGVVNGVEISDYYSQQITGSGITEARRGTIFDKDGKPIAMDATSYSLYAVLRSSWDSNVVDDPDHVAKILSEHIGIHRDDALQILLQQNVNQVEFGGYGQNISPQTKEAIEATGVNGLVFVSHSARQYINDYFSSHLIGYADSNTNSDDDATIANILSGKIGIEQTFDTQLSGVNQQTDQPHAKISGENIYLTLDSRLQNVLESLMTKYYSMYQPKAMNVYLVEIPTGKLIAASQRPTFNLNTRDGIEHEWKNLLVGEAYEPGSTIKILTMGVAKDLNLFNEQEVFKSGSIKVYDQTVKDYNLVGWGNITFEQGFIHSSNVGMVNLVNRMGADVWVDKLQSFGFGHATDFGISGEVTGNFVFDNPVSKIMSGFGQGFSATPIQLLQAYSSVANHGKMLKIQYLDGIGTANQFDSVNLGQPMSEQAAHYVLNLMSKAVDDPNGTAAVYKSNLVKVAAKTGTAQIANSDGTGYLSGPDDYYHSVITMFPADSPQYMLYISMKQFQQDQTRTGTQIMGAFFGEYLPQILVGN